MKNTRILLAIVLWLSGSMLFYTCQNDEFDNQTLTLTGDDYISEEDALRESALLVINNQQACINPDDPVYVENTQQETAQWGNPKSPFIKTVDIAYYSTLTHFALKVKSTHGFADLLIDGESVWVNGPVGENEWGVYSVELPVGWAAGDIYSFALKVAGYGPPAFFDVEYHLIGECTPYTFYTLTLAVNPEGKGSVTGEGEYMEGEEVALTATANEGWEFVNWTDGDDVVISAVADFTYTMPAGDVTLTANFVEESLAPQPCPGMPTVTDIDGNVYNTVLIGDQCWVVENLKTTRYRNGDYIPTNFDNQQWSMLTSGAYAIYPHSKVDGINSDEEMVYAYGLLYNWYAVDDSRGLCPPGWYVPSDDDWETLVNYVVAQGYTNTDVVGGAGNALKSRRQVDSPLGAPWATSEHPRWDSHSTHHGLDVFGFSGLPGGHRDNDGWGYFFLGPNGYWWSSTEFSTGLAWRRTFYSFKGFIYNLNDYKQYGYSVRCLKD